MNCFTEEQLNRISHLIREIEKLTDVEKLFLYLQLPCGRAEGSEGKSSGKFNGSKSNSDLFSKKPDQETTQTYTWILSHLEVDPNVSLPKQEVYDEYRAFCQANRFEPLCVADFGKAMKHAFPCIKPRRLGQRGNSRYCYSGLRKKYKIQPPNLPDMIEPTFCIDNDCSQAYSQIIKDYHPENPDECQLNNRLPNFTGYEVMNLKIDPGSQQQQQQHNNPHHQQPQATAAYHLNGNSGPVAGGPPHYNSGEHSGKIQQTTQIIQRPTLNNLITRTTNGGSNNNSGKTVQLTQNSIQSAPQDYVPSAPMAIVSNSPSRYDYATAVIQQPGTPDDDDYRHNYQDMLPINRHPFTSSVIPTSATAGQQASTASGVVNASGADGGFMYSTQQQQQHQSKVGGLNQHHQQQSAAAAAAAAAAGQHRGQTDNCALMASTATTGTGEGNQVEAPPGLAPFAIQTAAPSAGSANPHVQLYRMDSSHIDSCASPFQSPASTPYPMMAATHMGQEIQDYYSNDCVRYSG